MRVLIAPQAFKGSLTALEAAQAMAEGTRRALPRAELLLLPVADGGDGTLEVLMRSREGRAFSAEVTGPLGQPVTARWGVLGDGVTAVIESAQACGLLLVPPSQRNPEATTTYGVGQLMRHALDAGYRRLIIGVGGTATNDGGVGLAQALGGRFLDDDGRELSWGGAALLKLATTDTTGLDPRISQGELLAAVDVSNPLCGPQGAALTYASQKGASSAMVELLDQALAHLAEVVHRQLHREVEDLPGAGAGGGLGAGLAAFLGARLVSGADLVCDLLGLDKLLEGVDLVVVGEGRLDLQTAFNKAPVAVARRAEAKGIPAVAIGGSLGRGYQELYAYGIEVIVAAAPESVPLEEAMRAARHLVAEAAERAVRLFLSRRG